MSWPLVKLKKIGSFQAGNGFPSKYQGKEKGDYPFAKVGDSSSAARAGKKYLSSANNYVNQEEVAEIKGKTIPVGSIVFAKIGEAIRQNFRTITSVEMLIDNNCMALVPNREVIDVDYLYFWMRQLDLYMYVGATTVPALRKSTLEDIEIPLPPLDEQKRIAAILDKADAIRQKRKQAIDLADVFLRSVFLDMFGDPVTNPKGFPVGTIRDIVSTVNYGTSGKASETVGKFPILRMGNITYKGGWDFSDLKYIDLDDKDQDKYLARKNDLLFNRTNSKELVGKTAVFNESRPMAIAGYLIRVRTNELGNPWYISGYLNSVHGKQILLNMCKSIVGMANINAQELQDINILLPPVELQNKYESIVKEVNERVSRHHESVKELQVLFNSLSQKAFSGQL